MLLCLGLLFLVGIVVYYITHLPAGRPVDTRTDFDITTMNVTASVTVPEIYVHVAGAVQQPGVYRIPVEGRAYEALQAAGGALPNSDLDSVNLSKPLKDGERIVIKARHDRTARRTIRTQKVVRSTASKSTAFRKVDLAHASAEELDRLPGIGPKLAERIIAFRATRVTLTLDDLAKVPGMNKRTVEKLRDHLTS